MIKTEQEYRRFLEQIREQERLLEEQREELQSLGLTSEQVERGLGPALHFQERVRQEMAEYEQIQRGEFDMTCTFDNIGRKLIAFRIYKRLSQAELAKRLGVSAPQVSRDERNEYSGASMEKIKQVLKALDFQATIIPNEINRLSV